MIDSWGLVTAIRKSPFSKKQIANFLGLTCESLRKKIYKETEFKICEVEKLCEVLNISPEQRDNIFFAQNVDKNWKQK